MFVPRLRAAAAQPVVREPVASACAVVNGQEFSVLYQGCTMFGNTRESIVPGDRYHGCRYLGERIAKRQQSSLLSLVCLDCTHSLTWRERNALGSEWKALDWDLVMRSRDSTEWQCSWVSKEHSVVSGKDSCYHSEPYLVFNSMRHSRSEQRLVNLPFGYHESRTFLITVTQPHRTALASPLALHLLTSVSEEVRKPQQRLLWLVDCQILHAFQQMRRDIIIEELSRLQSRSEPI